MDLYVDYVLNKSVSRFFTAFSRGFLDVAGGPALDIFRPDELQQMVIGNEVCPHHVCCSCCLTRWHPCSASLSRGCAAVGALDTCCGVSVFSLHLSACAGVALTPFSLHFDVFLP